MNDGSTGGPHSDTDLGPSQGGAVRDRAWQETQFEEGQFLVVELGPRQVNWEEKERSRP